MAEYAWIITIVVNLVAAGFIVMQVRISLERRLTTMETLVKILMREKGMSGRASDDFTQLDERHRRQ